MNWLQHQLQKLIEPLTAEAYAHEVHALFELTQNADDAIYKDVTPTMELKLKSEEGGDGTPDEFGRVRIGRKYSLELYSNEIGFSKEDVVYVQKKVK